MKSEIQNEKTKIVIGIITYTNSDGTYDTAKYLPYFLKSLLAQDHCHFVLVVVDVSEKEDNKNSMLIRTMMPEAEILRPGSNIGFSKSYNILIDRARELGAELFLASNVDMFYKAHTLSTLVSAIRKDKNIGSVTGKLYQWNFQEKDMPQGGKTTVLDSAGMGITLSHHFFERGQGMRDQGQYEREEAVFGASGTCVLYRMNALLQSAFLREDGRREYFDELMFMYKEDADLSYRLQLEGYACRYVPQAVAYHDRSTRKHDKGLFSIWTSRKYGGKKSRALSWAHHFIILHRYIKRHSLRVKTATFFRELLRMAFVLLFEHSSLREAMVVWESRQALRIKKHAIQKRYTRRQYQQLERSYMCTEKLLIP